MPKVVLQNFQGTSPRVDRQLLDIRMAQVAENCDLLSGKIVPFTEPGEVFTLPDSSRISIFPYPDATNFISFVTDVDFVRSPVAGYL